MKQTDEFDWVGRQDAGGPASEPASVGRLGGVHESMTKVTSGLSLLPLVPFSGARVASPRGTLRWAGPPASLHKPVDGTRPSGIRSLLVWIS